jgi:hypothetical protein
MASLLEDEGFGTFERCMSTIRVLRGDITRAKEILSNVMISEAQFK